MEELINAIQDLGEISWLDYVQLIATIISIIISAVAVFFAVKVPIRIAEEQNRIALFEKRSSFYFDFCRCISFCEALDTVETKEQVRLMFYTIMSNETVDCELDEIDKRITPLLMKMASILSAGDFLFNCRADKLLEPIIKDIIGILSSKTPEEFSDYRNRLKKAAAIAKEQLTPELTRALILTQHSTIGRKNKQKHT